MVIPLLFAHLFLIDLEMHLETIGYCSAPLVLPQLPRSTPAVLPLVPPNYCVSNLLVAKAGSAWWIIRLRGPTDSHPLLMGCYTRNPLPRSGSAAESWSAVAGAWPPPALARCCGWRRVPVAHGCDNDRSELARGPQRGGCFTAIKVHPLEQRLGHEHMARPTLKVLLRVTT